MDPLVACRLTVPKVHVRRRARKSKRVSIVGVGDRSNESRVSKYQGEATGLTGSVVTLLDES